MEVTIFSGKCPQCQLANTISETRENNYNFWECPECQLQIIVEGDCAGILQHRGIGNFQSNLLKLKKDYFLEETNGDTYSNGNLISDKYHLKNYLENQVHPIAEFTFSKLIDTFVNYKFNNASNEDYNKQSQYFKIDFEDITIEDKLIERDQINNQNYLYAHSRLYTFLKRILEKYYHTDNSWLPEMGMSKIEYYLCRKHFSVHDVKMINSNSVLIKQRLKELTLDLINIIYLNEEVLLSYDLEEMKKIKQEQNN
jgi:hypothetical protein